MVAVYRAALAFPAILFVFGAAHAQIAPGSDCAARQDMVHASSFESLDNVSVIGVQNCATLETHIDPDLTNGIPVVVPLDVNRAYDFATLNTPSGENFEGDYTASGVPAFGSFDSTNGITTLAPACIDDGSYTVEYNLAPGASSGSTFPLFTDYQVICPVPPPVDQVVEVLCNNNINSDTDLLAYELEVTPLAPVVDSVPVDVALTGVVLFPQSFLNAAVSSIPNTPTEVTVLDLVATVKVRAGASGPAVALGPATGVPAVYEIPVVNDSETCELAGFMSPCVLEPLRIPLESQVAAFTPTDGAGGQILFGWDETRFPPITVAGVTAGPIGTRVSIGGVLNIGLECGMGTIEDAGTPDPSDDFTRPLDDTELTSIPIFL